jgi:hypothetical protein
MTECMCPLCSILWGLKMLIVAGATIIGLAVIAYFPARLMGLFDE